jgi:hypothetical protein
MAGSAEGVPWAEAGVVGLVAIAAVVAVAAGWRRQAKNVVASTRERTIEGAAMHAGGAEVFGGAEHLPVGSEGAFDAGRFMAPHAGVLGGRRGKRRPLGPSEYVPAAWVPPVAPVARPLVVAEASKMEASALVDFRAAFRGGPVPFPASPHAHAREDGGEHAEPGGKGEPGARDAAVPAAVRAAAPAVVASAPPLMVSAERVPVATWEVSLSEVQFGAMLGEGAFGRVFRGRWRGTDVAVKLLLVSGGGGGGREGGDVSSAERAAAEEFRRECAVLAAMRHPNILLFMGACTQTRPMALITELASRGSLWDVLRSPWGAPGSPGLGPPLPVRLRIAADAARGMLYLHSMRPGPVLHRDLKSANVLVDAGGTGKLSDFGLARVKAVAVTMTGNAGTIQWCAPEVLANERYSESADVYSFGIVLWECLHPGVCPFEGRGGVGLAMAIIRGDRPAIDVRLRTSPLPAERLVLDCLVRCWAHNPDHRPTFAALLPVIEHAASLS